MKQISAATTVIWKLVFPVCWIAVMGVGAFLAAFQVTKQPQALIFLLLWALGGVYFVWFARRLKFVSIDENFLYVSQSRKQILIPLNQIRHVKENFLTNPKLITLTLNQRSDFGWKIVFVPTGLMFAAFRSHPIVPEIQTAVQRSIERELSASRRSNRRAI